MQKESKKTREPDPQSPLHSKMLASPHFESVTNSKLSPLSTFLKNSPKLKASHSERNMKSSFVGQGAAKKTHRPSTLKPSEDEKQAGPDNQRRFGVKRTPWLDTRHAETLLLSPSLNPEGVRIQTAAEPVEEDKTEVATMLCACGQFCEGDDTQCPKCKAKTKTQEFCGYLYEITKEEHGQLKRFYYTLLGQDLYRTPYPSSLGYKSRGDQSHDKLYSLVGLFVKDEGTDVFANKVVLHSFTLSFMQQSIKLYAVKKEEKEAWIKAIKAAVGYSSLYDFYTVQVKSFFTFRKPLARASSASSVAPSTNVQGRRWPSRCSKRWA